MAPRWPPWLPLLLWLGLAAADRAWPGHFVIPRVPSSCSPIVAVPLHSPVVTDDCLLYHLADLQLPVARHVTYVRDGDRRRYWLRMATLGVRGRLGRHDLSFYCPTEDYYGTPPIHCSSSPGLQAAVLHVGEDDRLYGIDVVRSPAAYPPLDTLAPHRTPFGVAQLRFPAGVPLHAEYLQVCLRDAASTECTIPAAVAPVLLPQPPGAASYGRFFSAHSKLAEPGELLVDHANQLMVSATGNGRYYFNSAGFFASDGQTCSHSPAKTFTSQLGGYGARFLDYVGNVTVVGHAGHARFTPVRVALWVGVAFDVTAALPIMLYIDAAKGTYRGMGICEIAPSHESDSMSCWYDRVAPTVPGLSVLEYAERMAKLGDPCAPVFHRWLHPNHTRACPPGLVLRLGLCREELVQPSLLAAADAPVESLSAPMRWAAPAGTGLVGVLLLGCVAVGLRWAGLGGRPTPTPAAPSLPRLGPIVYKTFETF